MNEQTKIIAKQLLKKVQKGREYSQPFHPAQLFMLTQDLIKGQAWLISPLLDAETAYRQKVVDYKTEEIIEQGKIVKISNTEAENKAKITQEYQDYKYLKYVDKIIEQQILLIKKFADKLTNEESKI